MDDSEGMSSGVISLSMYRSGFSTQLGKEFSHRPCVGESPDSRVWLRKKNRQPGRDFMGQPYLGIDTFEF
jgi:hypothetical protein